MDSFLLALGVVAPLFIWMIIGYVARLLLKLKGDWVRQTNFVMYKIFFAVLMFKSMVESDISLLGAGMAGLAAYVLFALALIIGALLWIVPRLEKENRRRGVLIQSIFRSNTALFGLPIAISVYGADNVAAVSLILACVVPVYNIVTVLVLEHYRGARANMRDMLRGICTNPLILGIAAGLVANLCKLPLPAPVKNALWGMADCATPVSFFLLGASFQFASAMGNVKAISAAAAAKLVALPLIVMGGAVALGFRNQQLLAVLMVFGPPTAVSSYPMAVALGGDGVLASEIVVFTSLFAVLTIFLWLFGLKSYGLL